MSQAATQRAQPTTPPAAPASGRRRWFGLVAIALAQLMVVLDATIVNVALPTIKAELQISAADRQWVITAYTLAFAGLLLLGGRIADYTGRKRTFLVGLVGFAAASAAGGTANSLEMLLAARAAQGAFGALLAPAALSLLSTTFTDPEERGKAFAVFGAVVASGASIGLILGGVLTTYLSWHWVLYVNTPIAVVAALGAVAFLRETRTEGRTSYDVPGAVLATGGLVALVYGFTKAVEDGWSADLTLGLLAAGAALLLVFLLVEAAVRNPLLPLPILRDRGRGGAYLAILLTAAGMFGVFLFLSFYLQGVKNYSALETGLAFLPMTGGILLSSGVVSQLMTRVPPRFLMGPGLLLAAAGMALLARLDIGSEYPADVLPFLVMVGLGLGSVFPPAVNLATFGVRAGDSGAASATLNTSQMVGGSLGTALLNTIAANATADYLASRGSGPPVRLEGLVQGYNMATAWGAGILATAGLIALVVINTRLGRVPDRSDAAAGPAPEPPTGNGVAEPTPHLAGIREPPSDLPGAVTPSPDPRVRCLVRTANGSPAAGAAVTFVDGAGHQVDRGLTGEDGSYEVTAPGTGRHVLVARADGHRPQARTVEVTERPVVAELVLPGSGEVTGYAHHEDGTPVNGATVTVVDERGDVVAAQRTDPDGGYRVGDLAAGTYTLVVAAASAQPAAAQVSVADTEKARRDIQLLDGGRLEGTVRAGVEGRALADAQVTLIDTDGNVAGAVTTGEDGRYEFTGLSYGGYTVVASGYPPLTETVRLEPGEAREHDVTLAHTIDPPPR